MGSGYGCFTGHLVQPKFSLTVTTITPGLGTLQAGLLDTFRSHGETDCGLVPTPPPWEESGRRLCGPQLGYGPRKPGLQGLWQLIGLGLM